jgi:hypothetical protein
VQPLAVAGYTIAIDERAGVHRRSRRLCRDERGGRRLA